MGAAASAQHVAQEFKAASPADLKLACADLSIEDKDKILKALDSLEASTTGEPLSPLSEPEGKVGTWLIFDVNETVLDLGPVEEVVNEKLGDDRGFDYFFNKVLSTSHVAAHTGAGADFTQMQKCSLMAIHQALGKKTGRDLTEDDWTAVRTAMGTMPCHPDVPKALDELKKRG